MRSPPSVPAPAAAAAERSRAEVQRPADEAIVLAASHQSRSFKTDEDSEAEFRAQTGFIGCITGPKLVAVVHGEQQLLQTVESFIHAQRHANDVSVTKCERFLADVIGMSN